MGKVNVTYWYLVKKIEFDPRMFDRTLNGGYKSRILRHRGDWSAIRGSKMGHRLSLILCIYNQEES